jgi:hypothetical protein
VDSEKKENRNEKKATQKNNDNRRSLENIEERGNRKDKGEEKTMRKKGHEAGRQEIKRTFRLFSLATVPTKRHRKWINPASVAH